jgi:biotin transport system ATP-binding protein
VIAFESVTHRFGDTTVLDQVSLRLAEPRVAIIGSNGSGKSTLIRMINGLVAPTQGRVEVHGLDPARAGREVRRMVSFLFSDPDAQIVMPTVAEDVAFSLRRRRLSTDEIGQRVQAALARVGIEDLADRPAHSLSSGQKQLLAMAAILVTEPRILVCDEPTTLLDLSNTRRLLRIIDALDQQVVLVTHDLSIVQGWPRVIVLDEGRVHCDGPGPEAVRAYRRLHERGSDGAGQ